METVYLDHCATTPVRAEVYECMIPFMRDQFGNPSSIHSAGRRARNAVEKAREQVARLIGAEPAEIYFTGGGTEANNLALQGIAQVDKGRGKHIITSSVEHHAVIRTCRFLETNGFNVTYLAVDGYGRIKPANLQKALTAKTILVSIMHANNEVGTIEPIEKIADLLGGRGILFHTDAVQTAGKIPLNVGKTGIDLLSLSAHKMYGPKGAGALYVRKGIQIMPMIHGGLQEKGIRSGTENVAAIVGFGKACEMACEELESGMNRLRELRDKLQRRISDGLSTAVVNGHPDQRLPHVLSISVPHLAGEDMVREMDKMGIEVSSGSACTAHSVEISHVLSAMGLPRETAKGTVRFSLGSGNTHDEIISAADAFISVVSKLHAIWEMEASLGSRRCY